jgi:putative ABC transport system ATP-binding protein
MTKKREMLLHLENVWKVYQMGEVEVEALKDISVEIRDGDFVAIIGASGSGKSTMMNIIGCLDIPTRGSLFLKSQDILSFSESGLAHLRGRTIGFIFQQYNLIPTLSALQNVLLPLELLEVDDTEAVRRARTLLEKVGLGEKMNNRPTQMSGGEQQRVAIARALAADPDIILADEPTGNLDSATGNMVMDFLKKLNHDGKTIVMVTHDMRLAKYAHRIVELKDGRVTMDKDNPEVI